MRQVDAGRRSGGEAAAPPARDKATHPRQHAALTAGTDPAHQRREPTGGLGAEPRRPGAGPTPSRPRGQKTKWPHHRVNATSCCTHTKSAGLCPAPLNHLCAT